MIILIDIGNSTTKIGFSSSGKIGQVQLIKTAREDRTAEEYAYLIQGFMKEHGMGKPEGAVLCSVVPTVTSALMSALRTAFRIAPVKVSPAIKSGLKFRLKNVKTLGADRIAQAVAAHHTYGGNLVVISIGTATTVSVITSGAVFKGGMIMAGPEISASALAGSTASLPRVRLDQRARGIGRDTEESIRAGLIIGHAGAVERAIKECGSGFKRDLTVVATGGAARLISPYVTGIDVINPLLTLEGLRIIFDLNA